MIRFWVGLGKPSEHSCPTSNDVKDLFKVYGTVEKCQVKLHKNGNLQAIIGIRECKIAPEQIAAQLDRVVLKGVTVWVSVFKKSKMCRYLVNNGPCPLGFACHDAHLESELKNEAKETAAGERQELIQKSVPDSKAMIRFWVWVGLRKPYGHPCPTSDDVIDLFKVYGTVEGSQVKLHQNGLKYAIIGMRDCNISSEEIAAQLDGVVLKGVPVLVHLFKSNMCLDLANKGHCHHGFACPWAHSESELKNEAKEAAAGDRQELIQKPVTDAGAFKTLQRENDALKEEVANLKQKVMEEKQRNNDLADLKEEITNLKEKVMEEKQRSKAVFDDNAKMSVQIDQLTKEINLMKMQTAANDAKESIPGLSDSLRRIWME